MAINLFGCKPILGLSILILLILIPISSHADTIQYDRLSSAKAKKDRAAGEYYQSLKDLGPNATAEQVSDVRKKTLGRAQEGWRDALQTSIRERINTTRARITKSFLSQIVNSQIFKGFRSSKPVPFKVKTGSEIPQGPSRPEFILDGSKIDKEIEFKKRQPEKNH